MWRFVWFCFNFCLLNSFYFLEFVSESEIYLTRNIFLICRQFDIWIVNLFLKWNKNYSGNGWKNSPFLALYTNCNETLTPNPILLNIFRHLMSFLILFQVNFSHWCQLCSAIVSGQHLNILSGIPVWLRPVAMRMYRKQLNLFISCVKITTFNTV